jgi:hypothetical protein
MRVEWAIPCMHLEQQPNGLLALRDACFNRVTAQTLPSEVGFIVALRLSGQPEEFAEEAPRALRAQLLGTDMDEIQVLEFEAPVGGEPPDTHPAGWEVAMTLPVVVQFEAADEGSHSIDFYGNGKLQAGKSVTIWVALATPPPTP